MDVILKVIEGAKAGAKIAVKKNEFFIGRSQECHLCAASSAISRKHCKISRSDNRVTAQDLGSRNGTLINGVKIDGEVELVSGDELTVGPLKFMVTISPGLNNGKRDQVKSVAEVIERVAQAPASESSVDDISQWLLGPSSSALNETQTIRIDDTNAGRLSGILAADTAEMKAADAAATEVEAAPEDEGSRIGKGPVKRAPGKLPKHSGPTSKDSREAAAEALRNWSRRR